MSELSDDWGDMFDHTADDEVFEALLEGSHATGDPALAGLVESIRAQAQQPPVPSDALALLLTEGLDLDAAGTGAAVSAAPTTTRRGAPANRAHTRIATRVATLSLTLKALLGASVAVAAVGGAGAAGVLPEPAQKALDQVLHLQDESPQDAQDRDEAPVGGDEDATESDEESDAGATDGDGVDGDEGADTDAEADPADDDENADDENAGDHGDHGDHGNHGNHGDHGDHGDHGEGPPTDTFGATVSSDARGESDGEPGVHGPSIAEQAQQIGSDRPAQAQADHPPHGDEGDDPNEGEEAGDHDAEDDDTDDAGDAEDASDADDAEAEGADHDRIPANAHGPTGAGTPAGAGPPAGAGTPAGAGPPADAGPPNR